MKYKIADLQNNPNALFRKKPTSLEKKNKKGETTLHNAAVKGDVATVRSLLERGADPNTVDNAGWGPLHEVSITGTP